MTTAAHRQCWECGEYAPAGVCVRPHPGYSKFEAIRRGFVSVDYSAHLRAPASVTHGPRYRRGVPREPLTCRQCGATIEGRYRPPTEQGLNAFCSRSHAAAYHYQERIQA